MLCGKDHDGFRVVFVMLKVSRQSKLILHDFVTSKQQICGADKQHEVINLDLIDSFSMVENPPQPE